VDSRGLIGREFHIWLQRITRVIASPFIGDTATGPFTVQDGQYGIIVKRLTLTGADRAALVGSARLVICG
jgi:hypothetical protein